MNHETGAHLSLPENLPFLPGTDAAMVLPRAYAQEAKIYIYSLNLMGQAKTNHEMALLLYRQIKDRSIPCDMLVTIEAKAIALTQELAVLLGQDYYIVLRKSVKAYMRDTLRTAVRSITTEHKQFLYLDGRDAELLKTVRHPVFIDDVIS
ncbi:MAG: hypothetical protein FWF47_07495, partial [Clostridia bacterium]|nr:hypothetical protein [Clostridia bacterium]